MRAAEEARIHTYIEGAWQIRKADISQLSAHRETLRGNTLVFLPDVPSMSAQVAHDLQDSFGISASTWEKQYRKATGYYFGSPIVSSNGEEEAVSTSLRFLIKTPGKAATVSNELSSGITYEWTEIGLWTQYRREHSSILFCCVSDLCKTGFVDDVRASLTQSMPISLAHPFGWHAFVLPHISRAFHVAVWKCRDLIRDVEKRRPSAGKRPTDYYALHELSRHVLHSTETLSMAVEVTQSVIEDLQGFRGQHWLPQQDESVEKIIRCQKTLLQCERGRSEALAGRLRNEIDLAFHIGTQHDSLVASRISELARVDSASVKTISILGLVFLPGTFVSAIFGMNFFDLSPDSEGQYVWTTSTKLWMYWTVTVPLTLATIAVWYLCHRPMRSQVQ